MDPLSISALILALIACAERIFARIRESSCHVKTHSKHEMDMGHDMHEMDMGHGHEHGIHRRLPKPPRRKRAYTE